jgi:hypothetical protein
MVPLQLATSFPYMPLTLRKRTREREKGKYFVDTTQLAERSFI